MKLSDVSKLVGVGALSLSLSVLPSTLPVSAQTNNTTTDPNSPTLDSTPLQETDPVEGDRDFDWGWLGLLGLAGLAGLARKKEEPVRYREPDVVGRSSGNIR
ncbi:WGxxGxxG family protein [Leptolyngbya sp. FACHB-261]|uniref:WGxxGxxG family protein n=1 Tax=Leptolyngbya sp. FACHB-261 TaxID=2692806 RepID=UPI001682AF12|nr:WGxxGxxG family protein [Leptolyngbya sp. FACHB-261]MBD2103749.1 WGxxGxxG-CTERM domain-containing protein [Leptolyngbya sp. FACHB-261]